MTFKDDLLFYLPGLRRYARALVGDQAKGDAIVKAAVGDLLAAADAVSSEPDFRLPLYRAFNRRFAADKASAPARPELAVLSLIERQLLLLTALESLPDALAAATLDLDPFESRERLAAARTKLKAAAATDVLIIEDEPIIAFDIAQIVRTSGHRVVGIAATRADAVRQAREKRPGLLLADINLGEGGSGSDAVTEILRSIDVPVIFVTAYPERLLTGERSEPAFVITKPFEPMALAIATFQAVATSQ